MGAKWHPKVQNWSEGWFLRRHEVGGQVQIQILPEQVADQQEG